MQPGTADLDIRPDAVLELAGHFSIPPLTRVPPETGPRFGSLSGLAPTGNPGEYFVVSDDRVDHRFYRVRVTGEGASFRVEVLETIRLDDVSPAPRLDPEAIVVTRTGDLLIASEGRERGERVPPAIAQFTRTGAFVRQLPIRDRFMPDDARQRGVRENAGFESLTMSPSGRRLFSATESALLQDGDPINFEAGTTARLLEFTAKGDSFVPAREFAYPMEALDSPPFTADATASGVVELLALSDEELLALERTFIGTAAVQGLGINIIRIFHVSLAGADDISGIDSLRGRTPSPVRKKLLFDMSSVKDLPAALTTLDNFEGLAVGPTLKDGSRSLLMVSDDNFNASQRSWFVQLRLSRQVNR
jgi:3-phytase/alkaline phosphatase D